MLFYRLAAVGLACIVLFGCVAAPPRHPLPETLAASAQVAGIPGARYWADEAPESFRQWLDLPDAVLKERYAGIIGRPHAYLLISGGGDDGAFGAGLLAGWTAAGDRPEFQIVTGISTGSIIAPFAFLGPTYDETLRELYTSYRSADLVRRRPLRELVRGDSAFTTEPMARLLDRYLGDREVAAIAAEGQRGRSLLIGTTNLDAGRPVIWDITRIAMSGTPNAKKLIHQVVLASSAIPGAFPPVLFNVEAKGASYDELHVDGGVTSQLFLGVTGLDWKKIAERLEVQGAPQLYLIRNSRLRTKWVSVERRIAPIVSRTVESLIRSQGIGDLAQIYITSEHAGMGFNLAGVPPDFDVEPKELFDPDYMRSLFDRGFRDGREGTAWLHR